MLLGVHYELGSEQWLLSPDWVDISFITNWRITMFCFGKSTISMAMFNSYVTMCVDISLNGCTIGDNDDPAWETQHQPPIDDP